MSVPGGTAADSPSSEACAVASALGTDWCNVARGFMFAVGCIQSQSCHTNSCPVGVATQDQRLQRAIVIGPVARLELWPEERTQAGGSEPLIEARMALRRSDWDDVRRRVPRLLPIIGLRR